MKPLPRITTLGGLKVSQLLYSTVATHEKHSLVESAHTSPQNAFVRQNYIVYISNTRHPKNLARIIGYENDNIVSKKKKNRNKSETLVINRCYNSM